MQQSHLQGVVDEVAASVGLVAVAVRIAYVPMQFALLSCHLVLARQLRGVGQARLVGILRLPLLVVLRGDTHAVGVALAVKVVEDILQLNAVFALAAGVGEVEHGAGTVVDSLLVVGRMAQVSTLLLLFVVGTEEVVEHVAVVLVGAAVVGSDQERKGLVLR